MPHPSPSLIEVADFTPSQIQSLFQAALECQKNPEALRFPQKTFALLFFEPSTRTRFSFETASARLGVHPLVLDGVQGTSLEKGESIEDTVMNIAAMKPEAIVIRCGDSVDLCSLQKATGLPMVNAGWGRRAHPTQALLDALTLQMQGRDLRKEKLLVVGDVKHSRVVSSHVQLSQKLGYEIAFSGPKEFLPEAGLRFEKLQVGLEWATAVMALRVQHERHAQSYSVATYREQYGIDLKKMKSWKGDKVLLHPGPVNFGVELDADVSQDPRCLILQQVSWGVSLRQALLAQILAKKA